MNVYKNENEQDTEETWNINMKIDVCWCPHDMCVSLHAQEILCLSTPDL